MISGPNVKLLCSNTEGSFTIALKSLLIPLYISSLALSSDGLCRVVLFRIQMVSY